ncbi:hypothetical protein AURDEDRAFT_162867 [Auricularia subglabra TFB-10046 SS5]|nr:hypothetical protein AURDEDRAFT_162867 [Auricularia subglabra TFB-10046 SS5]
MIPTLIQRSKGLPFALSFGMTLDFAHQGGLQNLWASLRQQRNRIRFLSFRSDSVEHYKGLACCFRTTYLCFGRWTSCRVPLCGGKALLILPADFLMHAPRLARLSWGLSAVPGPPGVGALNNVVHVRTYDPSAQLLGGIFSLFRRAETMYIRANRPRDVQPLPAGHPVQCLEVYATGARARWRFWTDLIASNLARVPKLILRDCPVSVLLDLCEPASDAWYLQNLIVDYDAVDAVVFCGTQKCHLRGLSGGLDEFYAGELMHYPAVRTVTSLTMTLMQRRHRQPFSFAPDLRIMPNLTTFILLCGRPDTVPEPKSELDSFLEDYMLGSLLEEELLSQCGTLRAAQLHAVRLQSRKAGDAGAVPPDALARFIKDHAQLQDGKRLPEAVIDCPSIQPADWFAALGSLVGRIRVVPAGGLE